MRRQQQPRCTLSPLLLLPSRVPCSAHLMPPKKFAQSIGVASHCPLLAAVVVVVDFMARCKLSVAFVLRFLLRLMIVTVAGNVAPPPIPAQSLPLPSTCCHAPTSHSRRRNRVAVCCKRCLFVSAISNEARAGLAPASSEPRAPWQEQEHVVGGVRGGNWISLLVLCRLCSPFFALSLQSRCNILFSIRI